MLKKLFVLATITIAFVAQVAAQTTTIIHHTWYDLTFYTKQCSSIMGYYEQTPAHTAQIHSISRTSFTADPKAPQTCATNFTTIYKNYNEANGSDLQHRVDKGHINPYQAFSFSDDAADESMLYSNVCPQISHVNEQEWNKVEAEVIKRARTYGKVKVWTGVLISTSHPKYVGALYMPDWYWKVISYKKDGVEMQEAWMSKNDPSNLDTKAIQAVSTVAKVKQVIKQYYPWFAPGF